MSNKPFYLRIRGAVNGLQKNEVTSAYHFRIFKIPLGYEEIVKKKIGFRAFYIDNDPYNVDNITIDQREPDESELKFLRNLEDCKFELSGFRDIRTPLNFGFRR